MARRRRRKPDRRDALCKGLGQTTPRRGPRDWRQRVADHAIQPLERAIPHHGSRLGDTNRNHRPRIGRVASSRRAHVVLRHGSAVDDPLPVVLGFLGRWRFEVGDVSARFGQPDLRLANRGGARIAATEAAAILERRRAIEQALRGIAPDASLAARSVPWPSLKHLFDAFADIRGVGLSKMTKALHPKRPALIPMLDSVVQKHLRDDDLGAGALFAERTLALVRAYKRDIDRNRTALRAIRQDLARRGYDLTEVRILDLLIWSVEVGP